MSKISRRLNRLRNIRFTFSRPSLSLITLVLLTITVFILGGGVYDVLETPLAVLPTPGNPIFYYPGLTEQLLNESIIFILFLIMGIAGGYLAYRSTRYAYRPREARMFLLIGLALMIVAFLGSEILLTLKGI